MLKVLQVLQMSFMKSTGYFVCPRLKSPSIVVDQMNRNEPARTGHHTQNKLKRNKPT